MKYPALFANPLYASGGCFNTSMRYSAEVSMRSKFFSIYAYLSSLEDGMIGT